jgi:1-acyl-sn-glycerol-3-phosphate acyltransferase
MPDSVTAAPTEDVETRVLAVVRELVEETGGQRALRALAKDASLERDLGLGSLERAELLVRLEAAFGRTLTDEALEVDTPEGLARMLGDAAARPDHEALHARDVRTAAARAAAVEASTIAESLWRHAQADPNRPHVYLRDGEGPAEVVTYGRLFAEASAVAGGLRDDGVRHGDTVALMLPTGLDFLRSFQGILLAGAVPVPIYPPVRLDRLDEYAERQSAILANAEVRTLITIERARGVAGILKPAVPTLRRVTTAGELAGRGAAVLTPESKGADAAFIQYTSGSTGRPKGVLLTHDNLLANIRAIGRGIDVQPTDVGVSWLPLYHDMGLIGTWLFCMHQGLPVDIQSPLSFLSRPERWLWAIHERRGTLSPAPNFAYELCVRRVSDQAIEGLDLSSWRVALNGAEPVSPDTLERFAQRFAPYGFRREAMMPVYGLAENSVALAFPPVGRGPRITRVRREPFEREGRIQAADDAGALPFVSVGGPLPENEIRLVDDAGADVGDGRVGRLQFRGPSATAGYYRQPEATAAMTSAGGWLDSGDLAFRHDGELYVAGRSKDLIIKGGRNLIPQEVEEIVAGVPGIRRGCVVAFGAPHETLGTERLVVVAETRTADRARRDALAAEVVARVSDAIGVPPDAVELVRPGDVPKTSSGKIQRQATRALYLEGALGGAQRSSRLRRARVVAAAAWADVRPRLVTVVRAFYGVYLAGLVAGLLAVLWPPAMLTPGRRTAARIGRLAARLLTSLAGARLRVEGRENLPADGAFVVASNHASYVDVPALMAALPRDVRFVAKMEILRWPLIGAFVRKTGHLTVDRGDAQQSVAEADRVGAILRAGDPVAFFPEGTFTDTAGLRPFRLGAFKTAAEHGVPVVPVALVGTRRWLRVPWAPRPGRIAVWIGPPVRAEGDGWRDVVALRDRVADAIASHCGEPRLDLVASGLVRS